MELFERIRYLSDSKGCSLAKIAKHIGVTPQTFNKWLEPKSQRNIWEHLEKILELFPDVRGEWLYRGMPPAFTDGSGPAPATDPEVAALKAKLAETEAELTAALRLNSKLSARLLLGDDGKAGASVARAAGHE